MSGLPLWVIGLGILVAVAWLLIEARVPRSREPHNTRPPAGALEGAGDLYDIWFVSGGESLWGSALIKQAGLSHRLAVVQHTARREQSNHHLDEPLWLALLDFMRREATSGVLTAAINESDFGKAEIAIDAWEADWNARNSDDRDPAAALVVRRDGQVTSCLLTEFWVSVGGPFPYADSYTYSVFASRDLSVELPAFLAGRCAGRWNQATEVLLASEIV